ncbi:TetR/AcrR family transcriptional regulator [Cellulophaga lytica]|uniref:TetR/AcrR family transcriptional regulator n=1 Tax=Cellulophaga lytica TaxID=979 RepID=UPI000B5C31DF|nr:TetR/AcrR family transcriptional regulator [Cellulophaga lytica]SNQ43516.1 Transcriptional regulator [Cellulophaga lytica]
MPREKQYKEEEVIEKAMGLFWKNGYRNTSLRMLSKEMGINQFSINASFGNKQKLFLESLKLYRSKLQKLINVFENSSNGIESIKHFFYQFAEFSNQDNNKRGCLMINTMSEFGLDVDKQVGSIISNYEKQLRTLFKKNLEVSSTKDSQTINRQTNYLLLAISGLALATKVQDKNVIEDYIETTFQNL